MAEPDFSGYATKYGIKCSDGRTISHSAFQHYDKKRVSLIWRHQHSDMKDVLGHVDLELRHDGVYSRGYFNDTAEGQRAKVLVHNGDLTSLSIFADNLVHQGTNVVYGDIREVSLVMSGANSGAVIDKVYLAHADGSEEEMLDAAIISMGLTLEHSGMTDNEGENVSTGTETLIHSKEQIAEIFSTFTSDQESAVNQLLEAALKHEGGDASTATTDKKEGRELKEIFDEFTEEQQGAILVAIDAAVTAAAEAGNSEETEAKDESSSSTETSSSQSESVAHSDESNTDTLTHSKEGITMTNLFEKTAAELAASTAQKGAMSSVLSHDALRTIDVESKSNNRPFSETFLAHAATYGIENIDLLFPDAKALTSSPDFLSRRMEWVSKVLDGTRHTPFARIKSIVADITAEEARAKGYIKGNYKKEEIIKMLRRVTTPKTVYKKQKLDRDDILDITEIDVVVWLKAEMRLMIDEEIAAAILVGDGREPDDEDKIDEDHIRPIAYDIEMYNTTVFLPVGDFDPVAFTDLVVESLEEYKGTGTPTLFTTAKVVTKLSLQKDTLGRRLYNTPEELAAALQVKEVVKVEAMGRTPDVVGVLVNLQDYTTGTDRGGQLSWFDDFDIDYNQNKYLIETRLSGALTRPKSAITFRKNAETVISAITSIPTFNEGTGVVTIVAQTGIVWKNKDTGAVLTPGAQSAIAQGAEIEVVAVPASGYTLAHGIDNDWNFFRPRP